MLRSRLKEDLIAAQAISDMDAQLLDVMKIYLQESEDNIDLNLQESRNQNIDFTPLHNAESTFKELEFKQVTNLLFTTSHVSTQYER